MIIRHQLRETLNSQFWCETCVMTFSALVIPNKGHIWNLAISNLAEVRNRTGYKDLFPRPRFRSDYVT